MQLNNFCLEILHIVESLIGMKKTFNNNYSTENNPFQCACTVFYSVWTAAIVLFLFREKKSFFSFCESGGSCLIFSGNTEICIWIIFRK